MDGQGWTDCCSEREREREGEWRAISGLAKSIVISAHVLAGGECLLEVFFFFVFYFVVFYFFVVVLLLQLTARREGNTVHAQERHLRTDDGLPNKRNN